MDLQIEVEGMNRMIIVHNSLLNRFKFWLFGGCREVFYPNRVEYRTGSIISFPLWERIYVKWFWRPKRREGQRIEGEVRDGDTTSA